MNTHWRDPNVIEIIEINNYLSFNIYKGVSTNDIEFEIVGDVDFFY